jgi:hypothetical protein
MTNSLTCSLSPLTEKAKGETAKMEEAQDKAAREVFDKVYEVSPPPPPPLVLRAAAATGLLTCGNTGTRARASLPSTCTVSRSSPP